MSVNAPDSDQGKALPGLLMFLYDQRQQRVADLERWRQLVTAGTIGLIAALGAWIAWGLRGETNRAFSLGDLLGDATFVGACYSLLGLAHFHCSWNQYRVVVLAGNLRALEIALRIPAAQRYYVVTLSRTIVYYLATNLPSPLLFALATFHYKSSREQIWLMAILGTFAITAISFSYSKKALGSFDQCRLSQALNTALRLTRRSRGR